MKKISKKKQTEIVNLRRQGKSYKEISELTSISVGSVHKYSKNIKLTPAQKEKLKSRDVSHLFPPVGSKNYNKYHEARRRGGLIRAKKLKPKYSRNELIRKLVDFRKKRNRLPTKRDFIAEYRAFIRVFGSWNNAVIAAGFNPNPVRFSKKYLANDGHKCDSLSEKIIDDWLHARGIDHKINYPYPGKDKLTVDFLVANFWIEFFGLVGEISEYDKNKSKKIKLAKEYSLNLIEIYPSDIFPECNLEEKIGFLKK